MILDDFQMHNVDDNKQEKKNTLHNTIPHYILTLIQYGIRWNVFMCLCERHFSFTSVVVKLPCFAIKMLYTKLVMVVLYKTRIHNFNLSNKLIAEKKPYEQT